MTLEAGMRERIRLMAMVVAMATAAGLMSAQSPAPALRWYKGNTHTHTLNSDGDSTPDDVVRWYREHGYNFLVLSDHNFLTSVDGLNALHAADQQFLVIKGEEVTDTFGPKPVHVNGLDANQRIVDDTTSVTGFAIRSLYAASACWSTSDFLIAERNVWGLHPHWYASAFKPGKVPR